MALIHKFIQDGERYVLDVCSGSVHVVDELIHAMLDEDALADLDELKTKLQGVYPEHEIEEAYEEIQALVAAEMLYCGDLYEDIAKSSSGPDYVKALCLNIIHDCNLRCKYCFADEGEYHGKREVMSAKVGKQAIDFVIEASGPRRNIEVDLFGGEPLMAFPIIKEIVAYARIREKEAGKNIRFTMTTNATLLNEENMAYLDREMGNLVLSIDGRPAVHDKVRIRLDGKGSFDRTLPKIKEMVARRTPGKQYYARGTFTRENTDFYEDYKFLKDQGFKEISIEPVVLPDDHPLSLRWEDVPKIEEQYDKLYTDLLDGHRAGEEVTFYHFNIDLSGGPCVYKRISGCGAGFEYVAVTPSGEIYPCHQFVGNPDYQIGTLEEGITKPAIQKTFREAHIYNKPLCRTCWARFYCSGGCQANNVHFTGNILMPYELGCELQKKRIETAIALKTKIMEEEQVEN
ncbi:Transcriptional regulatory protein [Clostridiaceae bacterium JG1575]|nr:Transcriptional regulatory protein [Clostridiaceae bacterium JG1575]